MRSLLRCSLTGFVCAAAAYAAEPVPPFSQTLTAEQKQKLGLANLSPAQLAELDAAVKAYSRGEATIAAQTAVTEYKKKQEPGVIARTLDVFKRQQEEDKRERFTARVVGEFRGWHGGTYFPLENGQVWRQVGTEANDLPPVQNAEVEIYRSNNGYWRLKRDGAWITVKRLQ